MRYVTAKARKEAEAEAYRFYVTDALYLIGHLNIRYAELIKPAPVETRTADEIIQGITGKLSRIVGGE